MKEYVGIIAALTREIAPLVEGWTRHAAVDHVHVYSRGNAVVACAGMGAARAAIAVEAALATLPLTSLLSVGLAGACDPSLGVGAILRAGVVIDMQTGERFNNSQFRKVVATVPTIADVAEKRRLWNDYGADATDMESATVARIAQSRRMYFGAIKAVSDEAEFELRGLNDFATEDGQFRTTAFAMNAATQPRSWKKLIELGKNSKRAISALHSTLECELMWYRERA